MRHRLKLFDLFLDLLYPPKCAFCRRLLADNEKGVCRRCNAALPRVPDGIVSEKFSNIRLCAAPLRYEGKVRESLHRYKFNGVNAYKNVYADFLAKCIDENGISCDIITWVPISRSRYRKRGYDQSEILAKELSEKLDIPCERLLVKTKNNPPQSKTGSAEKRKANAAGVYKCVHEDIIPGSSVLIIDDIVTTGATLTECAGTLKAAGAKTIYAAALASANG